MFKPGDELNCSSMPLVYSTLRLTLYRGLIPPLRLAPRCVFASAWMEEQLNSI